MTVVRSYFFTDENEAAEFICNMKAKYYNISIFGPYEGCSEVDEDGDVLVGYNVEIQFKKGVAKLPLTTITVYVQ